MGAIAFVEDLLSVWVLRKDMKDSLVWRLDDHRSALEAHVVVGPGDVDAMERLKDQLKRMLEDHFAIAHSTLEFERSVRTGARPEDAHRELLSKD